MACLKVAEELDLLAAANIEIRPNQRRRPTGLTPFSHSPYALPIPVHDDTLVR